MKSSLLRFAHDSVFVLSAGKPLAGRLRGFLDLGRMALKPEIGEDGGGIVRVGPRRVAFLNFSSLYYAYREIFVRENYFFRHGGPAPFILDCGANIGLATLYFKSLYPESQILAFEPDAQTFSVLQRNIAQNGLKGVVAHNCALWDSDGPIDFFVDHAQPGTLLMSANPGRMAGERTTAVGRRLSNFIGDKQVDFLKLDIEGAEERVLRELAQAGKLSQIRRMAIEYHHRIASEPSRLSQFLQILETNGFEYQIGATFVPKGGSGVTQDVMVYAIWNDAGPAAPMAGLARRGAFGQALNPKGTDEG